LSGSVRLGQHGADRSFVAALGVEHEPPAGHLVGADDPGLALADEDQRVVLEDGAA
jgi:hypothetical protein